MKQKIKTQSQPAWVVTYVTPDGKHSTFQSTDAMLKSHKMLMQNNSCIKSLVSNQLFEGVIYEI